VGLFDTEGVRPTHLDLADGGVAFGRLEQRTVVMHNGGACSPANNQLRLAEQPQPALVRFTAVAVHLASRRVVISTHWLPTTPDAERAVTPSVHLDGAAAAPCSLSDAAAALEAAEAAGGMGLLGLRTALSAVDAER
jgi:hypothetical protein